jgi:hypothetical protein
MSESRTIVRIEAREPEGPMTLAEWLAWREAENRRIIEEATSRFREHLERMLAETKH